MSDTRGRILEADDIRSEIVEVEEWDVKIEVRTLTGRERARMLKAYVNPDDGTLDMEKLYPALMIAAAFDPDTGEKLFTQDDAEAINDKSGAALEKVGGVAIKLSGLGSSAVGEAGKDSSSTPTLTSIPSDASTSS